MDHVRDGFTAYVEQVQGKAIAIERLDRPQGTGFSADTFIIDLESNDLPTTLVVQAAPAGPSLFDNHELVLRFKLQQVLAEVGVPVPTVRWLCDDPSWIGAPFLVMDFVAGRVPPDRPPYHLEGWLLDLEVGDRRAVWLSGIAAMAGLHAVDAGQFEFLGRSAGGHDRCVQWTEYGAALGDSTERSLMAGLATLSTQAPPPPASSHIHWGDAKMGNAMFAETNVVALMDWELCGRGGPAEDLAHWFAVDWFLSTGLGNPRLSGLPGPAESIRHYEHHSAVEPEAVEWWFSFALLRMGLIFQRAADQRRIHRSHDRPLSENVLLPHVQSILDGSAWRDYN